MNLLIRKKFIFIIIPLAIILSLASYFVPAYFFSKTQTPPPIILEPDTAEAIEGIASASPIIVTLNEPTDVKVTIELTDSRLIPASVNLQRLDTNGKVFAILGALNDAGTNGDTTAGDKTFSTKYTLTEATTTPVYLRVSWALKGVLRRVISNMLALEVWQRITEPISNTSFNTPPNWTVSKEELNEYNLYSPSAISAIDAGILVIPPDITVHFLNNSSGLLLIDFINTEEDGWFSNYKEITPIIIDGHEAIRVSDLMSEIPSIPEIAVFIAVNNKVVLITGHEDSQQQFNKIIESFQLP